MTSSAVAERLAGVQEPRVRNVPSYASSAGQEAIDFSASFGQILDPWQQICMHDMLGEAEDGTWAAMEFAMLVARQNGKGDVLLCRELTGLYLFGERLILHSAHEFKTASEAFLRLKGYVDNYDFLRKRVKRMPTAHGEEGLELINGPRLRFIARSRSSGRGFTGNCTIADEAQELPDTALQALAPTMSAVPNPQIILAGTVPTPENNSEVFTRYRDRGRKGNDPTLAWLEWNVGETHEDLDDPAALAAANPALGIRLTERYVKNVERGAMSDRAFARERLSLWSSARADMIIPQSVWDALADPGSEITGPLALAVGMPFDRRHATIAAAGRRQDGLTHLEVIDYRRDSGWVVDRLLDLVGKHKVACIVVDPGSAAGSLLPAITDAFTPQDRPDAEPTVPIVKTNAREYAQATGALYDAAMAPPEGDDPPGRLRHLGDPILLSALQSAAKRPLAGAWTWNAVESGDDISPLQAVTLAMFGLATVPLEPEPEVWGFFT